MLRERAASIQAEAEPHLNADASLSPSASDRRCKPAVTVTGQLEGRHETHGSELHELGEGHMTSDLVRSQN